MTVLEQLEQWVAGESVHNDFTSCCCPDFSCCYPQLKAPFEERELFAELFLNKDFEHYRPMLVRFMYHWIKTVEMEDRTTGEDQNG